MEHVGWRGYGAEEFNMSKRFTDTDKWKRPWFRELPETYRLFWIYLCDSCDHSGIWYVDFALASFMIGSPVDPAKSKEFLGKQIVEIDSSRSEERRVGKEGRSRWS